MKPQMYLMVIKEIMKYEELKTTLLGVGVAVANVFATGITPEGTLNWRSFLVSIGLAGLGAVSKDHNVTGGDKHQ